VFKKEIGDKFSDYAEIAYAYQTLDKIPPPHTCPPERKKPWGTAHAIMVAEDVIQEPFAVINSDDFYGKESFKLICDYLKTAQDSGIADYAMVGYILRNTLSKHGSVSRGVCETDDQGNLDKVVEIVNVEQFDKGAKYVNKEGREVYLSGDEIVSMNMWGFTPSFFGFLGRNFTEFLEKNIANLKSEYFITNVVDTLIKNGEARVKVLKSQNRWFGVTYREDKVNVIESIGNLINQGEYPENLMDDLCKSKSQK